MKKFIALVFAICLCGLFAADAEAARFRGRIGGRGAAIRVRGRGFGFRGLGFRGFGFRRPFVNLNINGGLGGGAGVAVGGGAPIIVQPRPQIILVQP